MAINNECMDWDDAIESDGAEFILLDEGDYNFTVTGFERGRFPGGKKLPACNKATLTLHVETDKGIASVRTDLILHRSMEWRLAAFFRCIGQKKHGERLVMDWSKVTGSEGRAHFKTRSYKVDDKEHTVNEVSRYYDYDPKFFEAKAPAAPTEDGWINPPEADIPFLPFN